MRTRRFGLAMMAVLFALHASAQQGPSGKVPPQLPSQASDKAKETVQARTAPTVSLTVPSAGALYTAPAAVLLEASATASSGGRSITRVEFFAGAALIGAATTAPYTLNWSNVAAGTYSLTARATDNLGVASTSAPVSITVNALPTVSFESPGNNALFTAPATIALTASAADSDGSIAQVEFFQGATLIATVTSAPYSFNLTNVAAGSYAYSARATDDRGAAATSTPVTVRVNAPPSVNLTSPASNATFTAPATIPLSVLALDSDGTVARVEFYNGASLIGELTAPPFNINWLLVPAGSYSLTARVTDDLGATAVSEAVSVTVNQATAQIYYMHTDHLNTPRAIYNQQQQLVWRWDNIDPFGGNVPDENPSGLGNFTCNLRFPGQYFDKEINNHYNYWRDYDSTIGRYIQSDPIGLAGGINTYAYVTNNPLRFTDPLGLATYMCTRRLKNVPFRAGPLYHQYICVGNSSGGFTCGGLGPTGSMFDSPGVIEPDRMKPQSCQLVQDDNDCVEKCIKDTFGKPPPNYSVDLSRGENCQTYADATVIDCVAKCKVRIK